MARTYRQLSLEERCVLQTQLSMGWSPAAIAAGLQRARSTISREMTRNGWLVLDARPKLGRPPIAGGYYALRAHRRAQLGHIAPRVLRKLAPSSPLWPILIHHLGRGLSPQQIACTLSRMPEPVRLSHETIYTALYAMPRGDLRARVLTLLRRRRMSRASRSKGPVGRPFVDPITLIDQRPSEVTERLVPGHWEGDLIKGKLNQSRIGTLVERKTLYVALVKLDDGSAKTTADSFAHILNRFDAHMRLSMTYDQGREMAQHGSLSQQTGLKVYFAHPHSPWERGINENTNGLLRQYFPKATDLSVFSQQQLDEIAYNLNARPRKSLGWKAPAELFLPEGAFDFVKHWSKIDTIIPVALGA